MSIVNRVKGFIRTITGALPLTLEGCVDEESIIDYTLYGQSVQNGTPTPETPVEVESVGEYDEESGKYKIPITVSGKNLFDIDTVTSATDSWYYSGGSYSYGLGLEAGKRYTFSCDVINNPGIISVAICRKPKISSWEYTILYSIVKSSSTNGKKRYTFVADGTECLWLYRNGGGELNLYKEYIIENIKNFQLEEGTTATEYEPYHEPITTNIYLDEPLRKVDDYADYVDFENGKVVRHIAYERIDTITNKSSNANVFFSEIAQKPILTISNNAAIGYAISDKFQKNKFSYASILATAGKANWIQSYITLSGDYRVAYIFDDPAITTVALAQEKIGDGFDVIYALATPTETTITLPTLPTFKGTTVISADTTIQPSNAEVTYYSTLKE